MEEKQNLLRQILLILSITLKWQVCMPHFYHTGWGQGWLQGYVIGGGGGLKENLTNSSRSMSRFDQLESVNVEV